MRTHSLTDQQTGLRFIPYDSEVLSREKRALTGQPVRVPTPPTIYSILLHKNSVSTTQSMRQLSADKRVQPLNTEEDKKKAAKDLKVSINDQTERQVLELEIKELVEQGKGITLAIGERLRKIRDKELYKDTHKNFKAYLKEVWHTEEERAYQMIKAASVVIALPEESKKLISNEGQAKALNAAPEEEHEEILNEVASENNGAVTAKTITAKIQERKTKQEPLNAEFETLSSDTPKLPAPEQTNAPNEAEGVSNETSDSIVTPTMADAGGEIIRKYRNAHVSDEYVAELIFLTMYEIRETNGTK
jgi:hypothetical protein